MLFATDKQTLDDLNIFGKHGSGSVYNIFNRCTTRGGVAVLEEMFQHPLSDDQVINKRSQTIRFFAATGTVFPFQAAGFDAIDLYLSNTDGRSKISVQDYSLSKRLSDLIARDIETERIYQGISAISELLRQLRNFLSSLNITPGHCYHPEAASITQLLTEPAFEPVLKLREKDKLTINMLAEFDLLFRFRYRDVIQHLLRHIYYLDVYLAVAGVAQERGFIFPKALPKDRHEISLEGVYHPQVKNAVGNTLHITPEGNVLFLTGANMAGKSTFMKSFSIALFLAHMGFPVPAKKLEFSVLDGIYTTINLPDNLGLGASHFYAEVLRVKKMVTELAEGKNLFVVFDELFRGTNVKDAFEATTAIVSAFAKRRSSIFLISTHIIEAAEVLKKCKNVRFVYLPTKMKGTHPHYTYTLEEGVTDDRHGMLIIKNEGILDILEAGLKKIKKD